IGSTTATGATTTFKDNGLASQAYVVSRGNEYELPQLVKILRVYLADTAGDQQPLVPTDLQTAAGIVAGTWDQTSGTIQGAPQYTPQYLAQQGTAFPVASQFGRPSLTVPWQNVSLGTQRPMYYLRGGFLGVLPPPLTTYTVKMDYVPQPPTLVANGDQSLFPDNFTDALAYKVLEYMAISDDNSRADSFRARYEQECRKLMDRFVSSLQGDKPRSLDPQTIRTDMRQWPT
ncbi:MAG: hypothetical protein KGL39_09255, partial [Patescibacteria group bacterium]|nr:hypothetical protein [Patescibacteria group bacterium]